MAEIKWTQEAQSWLKDIYDYIAADNPDAATRTVEGIYERAQLVRQHPEIGFKYETQSPRPIRILLYGHYRITYLLKEAATSIFWVFFTALWTLTDILFNQIWNCRPNLTSLGSISRALL